MHGVDFKRVGILLYAVVFLSYIAYLAEQSVPTIVEPPRYPLPADVGDGLARSDQELKELFRHALAVRYEEQKRQWNLEQRANEIREQDALLLNVEESSVEIAPVIPSAGVWITRAQLQEYLTQSDWPDTLHTRFINVASCESGQYDYVSESYIYKVNAIGDGGLAYGLGQVRIDYHPEKAARYDLHDALQNLNASYEIYLEAGNSFLPWSCSSEFIGRR